MKSLVATAEREYRAELGGFDSGLQITVGKAEHPGKAMDPYDAKETVALLASLHHGSGHESRCCGRRPDLHEPGNCRTRADHGRLEVGANGIVS